MIVLDIEISGGPAVPKYGIWQIGALDLDTNEEFLEEGRIDDDEEISTGALQITGKTEEELRDREKQSQKQLLRNFFGWLTKRIIKNFLCQNPQFDVAFIEMKAMKYGLKIPFHHRSFDLHTIAQIKFHDLNNKFLIENNKSAMNLTNILKFCGIEDNRKEHNALEDCKLEAECFSRLIYGKNLFPEYSKYKIPEELIK